MTSSVARSSSQESLIPLGEASVAVRSEFVQRITQAVKLPFIVLGINLIKVARWSEVAIRSFVKRTNGTYYLTHLQGLAFVSVLINIYNLAKTILISAKVALKEKVENAVKAISLVGSIGDGIGGIGAFLANLRCISKVSWISPWIGISFLVESVAVGLKIRNIVQASRHSKALRDAAGLNKSANEFSIDDFVKGKELILNDQIASAEKRETSLTKKYFNNDEALVKARLEEIESEARDLLAQANRIQETHPEEASTLRAQANERMRSTMKTLNRRITQNRWSNALSILATAVAGIGLAIILFSPLAPLGLAILALITLVELGRGFIYEKRLERTFKRTFLERDTAI